MCVKVTLTKIFVVKTSTEEPLDHGGNQCNGTRNMKKVNFLPKNVQNILSSHKITEKYNEQWGVLQRKLFLTLFVPEGGGGAK